MVTSVFELVDKATLEWMHRIIFHNSLGGITEDRNHDLVSFKRSSPEGNFKYELRRTIREWDGGQKYWFWEIVRIADDSYNILLSGVEVYCRTHIMAEIQSRKNQTTNKQAPIETQPETYGQW